MPDHQQEPPDEQLQATRLPTAPGNPEQGERAQSDTEAFILAMEAELPRGCVHFRDTGLINIRRPDESFVPVCGRLRVTAYLRDVSGGEWRRRIEILDRDGVRRVVVLSERDIASKPSAACAELAAAGLDIRAPQRTLMQMLAAWPTSKRVWTTSRPGWVTLPHVRTVYLTAGGTVCRGRDQATTEIELVGVSKDATVKGTLEGWQNGVGRLAAGNPAPMLAISTVLAGALLNIAGIDSLGINFHARTSSGKTTVLLAALSCFGDPSKLNRWNASATALERISVAANDGALILDEFPALASRPVVDALYAIGNGTGRLRGQRDLSLRQTDRWRAALLSTSERPIHQHLAAGRVEMPEGLGVRLIDIPAQSWRHGLFECLHEHPTPHSFAVALAAGAGTEHGHVLPAFVEWVIEHENRIKAMLPRFLNEFRSGALKQIGASDQVPGAVMRVIERIGLIATAGELGIIARVLPWPRHSAWFAARNMVPLWFADWNELNEDIGEQLTSKLKEFFAQNGDLFQKTGMERGVCSGGWIDSRWLYLDNDTFSIEIARELQPIDAARILRRSGILAPGKEARSLQVRLPSGFGHGRQRVYRFRLDRLAYDGD